MHGKGKLILALITLATLSCIVGLSSQRLFKNIRLGLEFNGGYEILYAVEPLTTGKTLTREELVAAAAILQRRANTLGMAEPEIALEGSNRIRIRIAGLSTKDQIREILSGTEAMPVTLVERYTQTVGGVLGIILGVVLRYLMPIAASTLFRMNLPAQLNWEPMALAMTVSVVVGVLSGIYPAFRASRLDPIEALRHD